MENRIQYFDFLRGIAVIMVVAIHAYPLSSDDGVSRVLRSLIGCAVPVFLAISGFFLSKKTFDNRKQYVAFLRRQVPKVYVPMLIWSLPMLTTVILKGDGIWQSVGYFFVGGLGVFYFIAVIIQCYVLLPILGKKPIGGGNHSHYIFSFRLLLTLRTNRQRVFTHNLCWSRCGVAHVFCCWSSVGQKEE